MKSTKAIKKESAEVETPAHLKGGLEMKKTDTANVQETSLNIYQKLLEIRKEVYYLKKDSNGFKYNYVNECDILKDVRPLMDRYGLILKMSMLPPKVILGNTGKTEEFKEYETRFVEVGFQFTWINVDRPSEQDESFLYLQDVCGDPKKMGGLMTYANKYFLLKNLQIATGDMDIDSFDNSQGKISLSQIKRLKAELNGFDSIKDMLLNAFKIEDISEVPADEYEKTLNAIANKKIVISKGGTDA